MWKRVCSCANNLLKQNAMAFASRPVSPSTPLLGLLDFISNHRSSSLFSSSLLLTRVASLCSSSSANSSNFGGVGGDGERMSLDEVKRLMRLVNVEELKTKLEKERKEVIGYSELLEACQSMGVARSIEEATVFARVLDEAGVVILFRDKVYLHPRKVVDLVRKAAPLALTLEDDPSINELKKLQEEKAEIDIMAHKQVRRILWCGLGVFLMQVGLFFRLTFWEFSWDIMEPITFFTTMTGIIIGYSYFLITSRDPTYQDFLKRLFLSRQRKLIKKHKFDVSRFMELQNKCKLHFDAPALKKQIGVDLELDDSFRRS